MWLQGFSAPRCLPCRTSNWVKPVPLYSSPFSSNRFLWGNGSLTIVYLRITWSSSWICRTPSVFLVQELGKTQVIPIPGRTGPKPGVLRNPTLEPKSWLWVSFPDVSLWARQLYIVRGESQSKTASLVPGWTYSCVWMTPNQGPEQPTELCSSLSFWRAKIRRASWFRYSGSRKSPFQSCWFVRCPEYFNGVYSNLIANIIN